MTALVNCKFQRFNANSVKSGRWKEYQHRQSKIPKRKSKIFVLSRYNRKQLRITIRQVFYSKTKRQKALNDILLKCELHCRIYRIQNSLQYIHDCVYTVRKNILEVYRKMTSRQSETSERWRYVYLH